MSAPSMQRTAAGSGAMNCQSLATECTSIAVRFGDEDGMPGSGDEVDPLSREHDAPSTPQLREILSSLLARHDGAAAGGHYRGLCRAAAAALPVRG